MWFRERAAQFINGRIAGDRDDAEPAVQVLDRSIQPTYCPIGSILAQKNREYGTASRNFALI